MTIFGVVGVFGQENGQVVRGRVAQEGAYAPVQAASVSLTRKDQTYTVQTDAEGRYRLEGVKPGRYTLSIVKEGFESLVVSDLVVNAGKELVEAYVLTANVFEVDQVDIVSNIRYLDRPSARQFTVEEAKRFAAVYFDPARLASSLPGVIQANDQANQIVVRGNSPNGILWRLEGVDIVNPNHLLNAGTFSDRPSLTGGGTILLSTQLLANSTFYSGAFPAQFGNALSGVFDMNLRQGNDEQYEFQVQAGLIGVDLAAEGPISRKSGASFLANYRYSTVGLLSQMGVDLGDEEINYQDVAFNLHFPTQKAGTFTLFGMGGNSFNKFSGANVDSIESAKDLQNIDYDSRMGAIGGTHRLAIGQRTFWESTVALSGIEANRTAALLTDSLPQLLEEDRLTQVKLAAHTGLSHYLTPKVMLTEGVYLTRELDRFRSFQAPFRNDVIDTVTRQDEGTFFLIQPYIEANIQPSTRLRLNLGLHAQYLTLNQAFALEPRLNISWRVAPNTTLRLAYGLHSQQQQPQLYFASTLDAEGQSIARNKDLGFTRAHHLVLSFQQQLSEHFLIRVEPYWQALFNVPVSTTPNSTFSTLNYIEGVIEDSLVNDGLGRNMGIELTAEKLLSNDYYFLLTGAIYDSKYSVDGTNWLDTRFNGRYNIAFTGGREFSRITKKGKDKTWGINLRAIYAGGFRAYPIDLDQSMLTQRTVFMTENGLTEQFADYVRIDLRMTFKRNRRNLTRTFGIDIQNLTSTRNIAYRAYDPVAGAIVDRLQLGIIPLLSYRIEF